MKDKVILVDCDGVLCDWVYAFDAWMARHGHEKLHADVYELSECYGLEKAEVKVLVKMFNESASICCLPPLRDAIKYIKKLHEEHGYIFHCITSLSLDPYAQKLRGENIRALFGETAFEKITCLDTGADKDEALLEYKDTGCYWVEDKKDNCDLGHALGLEALLIAWDHNADYDGPGTRVQNWKEIYDIVTG